MGAILEWTMLLPYCSTVLSTCGQALLGCWFWNVNCLKGNLTRQFRSLTFGSPGDFQVRILQDVPSFWRQIIRAEGFGCSLRVTNSLHGVDLKTGLHQQRQVTSRMFC